MQAACLERQRRSKYVHQSSEIDNMRGKILNPSPSLNKP
jgi:hypothetical protein